LVTGIIEVIMRNLSNILIGRYYDKEQVGYFSKGRDFADIPSTMMSSVLSTVLFPLLSEIHEDEARHLEAFKRVTFYTILFTFPVMIMMALLAKPLVIILFTENWAPCIPMLQAFLLARAFLPLNVINAQMLQSKGDTKLYMNTYFIAGPLTIIAIIVSIPFGVLAMAWATLISGMLYYIIFAIVVGRRIGYSFEKSLWEWRMIILSLLIMAGGVLSSIYWLSSLWAQLIIGGFTGIVVYASCCVLFKLVDKQMIELVLGKLRIKR
jgi:O-antigen/teichoic acid export membrane protein